MTMNSNTPHSKKATAPLTSCPHVDFQNLPDYIQENIKRVVLKYNMGIMHLAQFYDVPANLARDWKRRVLEDAGEDVLRGI